MPAAAADSTQGNGQDRAALEGALAQLRLRLLDLSARNRLLNFKHTAGRSLQFVEGQPVAMYQKLLDAPNRSSVSILGLPEPSRGDWVERNGRMSRPDTREWAHQHGISTSYDLDRQTSENGGSNVRALLYPDDLAKHCRKIEREAVSAIEETGSNMLFLVLGFLEFPEQRSSDRTFFAPLISVPVLMSKRDVGGNQVFSLRYTGDDITDNLSLREKLKSDYGLLLPDVDDDQIDVGRYLSTLEQLVSKHPGFVVRHRASLCILSFTNMLLVRDLDPSKWPQKGDRNDLLDHPIVRQVFEGRSDPPDSGLGSSPEYEVEDGPVAQIPLVFDADSSQHSALAEVLVHHRSLVIEGPPGTGKSQTITNLIAAALADGKKVLFVAEKLAALEVVRTRLARASLDPFVLELHSNKSNKKRVLEELKKRVDLSARTPVSLPRQVKQLDGYRNDLKAYRDLINSVSHNSFGLTIHQIMWRAETHRQNLSVEERLLTQAVIPDASEISEFELLRRTDCLGHLSTQYLDIGGFEIGCTFWGFFPDRLIPGDDVALQDLFLASCDWADPFVEHVVRYVRLVGSERTGLLPGRARTQQAALASLIESAPGYTCLHLVPGLFVGDRTGERARRVLQDFSNRIDRHNQLTPVIRRGLRDGDSATQNRLETLQQMGRVAAQLGVTLGNTDQIGQLCSALRRETDRLTVALSAVEDFCVRKEIPFDGSREALGRLAQISALVIDAPQEFFHLQHSGLARRGCRQSLIDLAILLREWDSLRGELNELLYLDMLPDADILKQAILALREHRGWSRVFQGPWRNAVAAHKRIYRPKGRISANDRLVHLERVVLFIQLRDRWQSDPAWVKYLGFPAPSEAPVLDGYLSMAQWNEAIGDLLEALPVPALSLPDLSPEKIRSLRREFEAVAPLISTAATAIEAVDGLLPMLTEARSDQALAKARDLSASLAAMFESQLDWLRLQLPLGEDFAACIRACEAAVEQQAARANITTDRDVAALLGDDFAGLETDVAGAFSALSFGQHVDTLPLDVPLRTRLKSGLPVEEAGAAHAILADITQGFSHIDDLALKLQEFGQFNLNTWVGCGPKDDVSAFAVCLRDRLYAAADAADVVMPWSLYVARRKDASEIGLTEFVDFLETKRIPPKELSRAYAYCTYATVVRSIFRAVPLLGRFSGLKHNQIQEEFRRLDREVIEARGRAIAAESVRGACPPDGRNGTRVDDKTEMVLLRYLMPQQRPRMPVRKMLTRAGRSIQALKPCFMMGPQAVAQYLTPGALTFDLVVMDEASQLKPEEAIGAIARGGQLVVVGDSKQLPPTSFWSGLGQTSDDDSQFTTTDAESILDVCSSHFHPARMLRWHYRSQHHSLIAFSNHHFYRGNLIVFPSPYGQSGKLGVRATYLANAVYDNQTNLREAKRVVDAVAEHINRRPDESLGVVTLNIKQRDLIAELLEERLRNVDSADAYRERWVGESQPLFIKNLENVQGDERDAIIISTTFGKSPGSDKVRQNFGPISRQGGWRRLNVLFTRARRSVALYTSLRPEDIVVDGTTPEGTKALRNYLEYARSGLLATAVGLDQELDSDFEVAVINVLQARGYEVTPQLGVAGFRIDIGVKHPDRPGAYLAAVECDGASYHSGQSVRDRDRIRQEILESLGWRGRIWRIWSTDWFRTPRQEAERLVGFLECLRKTWKPEQVSDESWIEEGDMSVREVPGEEEAAVHSTVSEDLLDIADELEVRVGDVVRYVDIEKPDDVLSAQISPGASDMLNGSISASTPLAIALLGAVAGDEVSLHLTDSKPRLFRIAGITRYSE